MALDEVGRNGIKLAAVGRSQAGEAPPGFEPLGLCIVGAARHDDFGISPQHRFAIDFRHE